MAFVETELHKIHLRLEALEAKAAESHLQPDPGVFAQSAVVTPPKPEPKHEVKENHEKKGGK